MSERRVRYGIPDTSSWRRRHSRRNSCGATFETRQGRRRGTRMRCSTSRSRGVNTPRSITSA